METPSSPQSALDNASRPSGVIPTLQAPSAAHGQLDAIGRPGAAEGGPWLRSEAEQPPLFMEKRISE